MKCLFPLYADNLGKESVRVIKSNMPMILHQHSDCRKYEEMLQSTFETRCSSAKIQFNNIQHIKKLEQENKRKDEENRKVNRKFAE